MDENNIKKEETVVENQPEEKNYYKKPFLIVIRIILAIAAWMLVYEFVIPYICTAIYMIPFTRIADGLVTIVCAIIAFLIGLLILRTRLEGFICLALCAFYLFILGILIPLAQGYPPYLNWLFADIAFGSIIGWVGSALTRK